MNNNPDHPEIYRSQAERYEALISREDYRGNLLPALQKIVDFSNKSVVDLGAGTGRLICQLAPLVQEIKAFDQSEHMLEVAAYKLSSTGLQNWQTGVADHRHVPVEDHSTDVVVSGWSVCYVVVDNPETWKAELDNVFAEIKRILLPGGVVILIETLGTGFTEPHPPEHLLEYYDYLQAHGFAKTWLRTDYRFENMLTANELSGFFFGDEMLKKIIQDERGITLPECTGIWWKTL